MRQVFLTLAIAALAALFATATGVAEETKIIITKKDCRRLVRHPALATSASDSATSNTALIAANRKAQKFAGLNMTVGKVRYNIKTGALTFNDQSLTDPDQDALAAACRSILKGGK
jgi:hypothetical protein